MSVTVIYHDKPSPVAGAQAEGDHLWLSLDELHATTGWELKPQGACLGEVCVPIPSGGQTGFLRDGGSRFNLAALARLLGQPAVHDDAHGVWFFGEAADARGATLRSLQAPDFSLPDLDGQMHSLSDYWGKKVLLAAWASW